jgi:hypothetical protein
MHGTGHVGTRDGCAVTPPFQPDPNLMIRSWSIADKAALECVARFHGKGFPGGLVPVGIGLETTSRQPLFGSQTVFHRHKAGGGAGLRWLLVVAKLRHCAVRTWMGFAARNVFWRNVLSRVMTRIPQRVWDCRCGVWA